MNILALDMATKTGWATNINRTSGAQTFDVKRGEMANEMVDLARERLSHSDVHQDGYDDVAAKHLKEGLVKQRIHGG